ncbi:glycosyltransferase [Aromatoleum anaerobium]|uniref:glycosyltransferase n=1 Tax=Aromatoleum anaerobium TaxID=182180 RepID=UPI00145F8B5C|nr:glycosyltransferase [Aromatoleum anaerobium]MCK0507729.1 glycosyltransferase [Aromatoleum anaerobium]
MKIAFFTARFPVLSETFVIRQVAGLKRLGHDVSVITAEWGDPGLAHAVYCDNQLGKHVRALRMVHGARWRMLTLARFLVGSLVTTAGLHRLGVALRAALTGSSAALLDIAAQAPHGSIGRFDAIVAHFGPMGVRAMYLREAGLVEGPIATIFHGHDMSDRNTVARHLGNYRRLFADTERMLPISALWGHQLQKWGCPPSRIEVLRMGVDVDALPALPPERPLGRPLRVLSVARFTEKKGLDYAIRGVIGARADVRLEIIGGGPLAAELHALAAPAGERVSFLGEQPQQAVFAALARADVFLLPSVTAADGDMEGIPVALMEAMASGILVLTTRHSAIPELVEHGVSGLLIDERDAGAISTWLERIATGAVDVVAIRTAARDKIEREFNNALLDTELARHCAELGCASPKHDEQCMGAKVSRSPT